jgi:hypothetical protein
MNLRLIHLLFFLFFFCSKTVSQNTVVNGSILDAENKTAIPYATVQFNFGSIGTFTDDYGRFLLESKKAMTEIKVSCMGYATQTVKIKPNQRNEITVLMKETNAELTEITVRPEKYKRKNPAADLVQEVFLHRDQNRKEGIPYYQNDNYEKMRFELNGITDKFKNKWYFKPFRFAFDFADTNKVNQKVALPIYFRERFSTSYFRRDPRVKKEKLWAERQTAFEDDYNVDKDGISTYLNSMYSEIDIYSPTILLLDKQFIGPLSTNATSFYRFYITDTVSIDSQRFASVYFSPINKNDLAFMGTMLVALDGSYAVRSVDMGVSKDINVNWVKEIKIRQHFAFQGDSSSRRLLLNQDELLFDFKVWKNKEGRSLLVNKRNFYNNYQLNQPQADSLYQGKLELLRDTGNIEKTPKYWLEHRIDSLTAKEAGIKTMIDSVRGMKLVKRLEKFSTVMSSGYFTMQAIQLGSLGSPFRYNDVEGFRPQLFVRTNDKYCKHFRIRGYTGYGFKDQKWKYGGSATLGLKGARPARFPVHQVKISYDHDLFFPGTSTSRENGLTNSAQSGITNRLFLQDIINLEYSKEFANNGISYTINALRKAISEQGDVADANPDNQAITTEIGAWIRYSPNEKIYQGSNNRRTIKSKFPTFLLQYKAGIKGLFGGEYAYQRASFRASKIFYLGVLGKTRTLAEVGKVFGTVSYPLLEIHRANQSYFFDEYGFSQMNYLEFVSDRYAMLHLNHDFGGILFNRIPLVKKYKLREGFTFKALYGGLAANNIPTPSNGLLAFPTDADKRPLTQGLGKMPYMEIGAGVGNIFGVLRLEYIWRLTYKELPNVQNTGVKIMFSADF